MERAKGIPLLPLQICHSLALPTGCSFKGAQMTGSQGETKAAQNFMKENKHQLAWYVL